MNEGYKPTSFAVWAGCVIGVLLVLVLILGLALAVKLLWLAVLS